jgi:hypothetical protein
LRSFLERTAFADHAGACGGGFHHLNGRKEGVGTEKKPLKLSWARGESQAY